MKDGAFLIALVTAPDLKTARMLARAALKARLAACANLIPKLESHYWWQGKIEKGTEVLLLLKTTGNRVAALEKLVVAKHPYDTPEFVTLRIHRGNERYLDWWRASVANAETQRGGSTQRLQRQDAKTRRGKLGLTINAETQRRKDAKN